MSVAAPDVDLRAAARRLRAAVDLDDVDGLHAELTRLRTAVMEQVHAARPSADPPPADPPPAGSPGAVVLDGRRRLLRLLTTVLSSPGDGEGDGGCTCLARAAEIELALRRQAELEASLRGARR